MEHFEIMLTKIVLTVVFLFLFLICRYYWRWYRFCKRIGIFGPVPVPFLGQMSKQIFPPGLLKADKDLFENYGPIVP